MAELQVKGTAGTAAPQVAGTSGSGQVVSTPAQGQSAPAARPYAVDGGQVRGGRAAPANPGLQLQAPRGQSDAAKQCPIIWWFDC